MAAEGLLVFDKPSGPTSFACVALARRAFDVPRVGHCGTLDPLAEGVLLLLLGRATKSQESFLGLEKQYRFRARWGVQTDTADAQGKVIAQAPVPNITAPHLEAVVARFVGETLQQPPRVSALKYKGRRYYEWARRGIEIPRLPRTVHIARFDVLAMHAETWEGRVICSRGTYIRTLVEDVAAQLGTYATLEMLIRERIGPHTRDAALSWEQLRTLTPSQLESHVHALDHHARLV